MKILQIGDKVLCRYFNRTKKEFYGKYFEAELINIKKEKFFLDSSSPTCVPNYVIKRLDDETIVPLYRKEIRDVIENNMEEMKTLEIEKKDILVESDLWQSLEEAKKLLRFIYDELSDMTAEKFSYGGDMEIREKIRDFLGMKK